MIPFCKNCKFFRHAIPLPSGGMQVYMRLDECRHSHNVASDPGKSDWYGEIKLKSGDKLIRTPDKINEYNRCAWFEQKKWWRFW